MGAANVPVSNQLPDMTEKAWMGGGAACMMFEFVKAEHTWMSVAITDANNIPFITRARRHIHNLCMMYIHVTYTNALRHKRRLIYLNFNSQIKKHN